MPDDGYTPTMRMISLSHDYFTVLEEIAHCADELVWEISHGCESQETVDELDKALTKLDELT